jgi:hypothetical protein
MRNIVIAVIDALGTPREDVEVSAFCRSEGRAAELRTDRSGNRYVRVSESDTLDVFILGGYLEFPVAGMDTLLLAISGVPEPELDTFNYIDQISVMAKRDEMIDLGFGKVSAREYSGIGRFLSMKSTEHLSNLKEYFQVMGQSYGVFFDGENVCIRGGHQVRLVDGTPIPALVILDGHEVSFAEVNTSYIMQEISSVMVMRVAPQYGNRGMGGAIVITTKK